MQRLRHELGRIAETVRGPALQDRKEQALAALGRPGFWDDDSRFAVLATANYLDRLEEAVRTAEKLAQRLERASARDGASTELAGQLALRLHVLDHALTGLDRDAPDDVYLRIEPTASAPTDLAAPFAQRLAGMYNGWAEARGMHVKALTPQSPRDGHHVLLLGGLGAATILADEPGLHILERPTGDDKRDHRHQRIPATVAIAPRPPGAEERDPLAAAENALAAQPAVVKVVRRYRFEPTPLVRDGVRGYRTGRLDRVLAGDFDLF